MSSTGTSRPLPLASPDSEGFTISRRPLLGFGLLGATIVVTLAVLIYLGAWASSDRIENRVLAASTGGVHDQGDWWEDSLLLACPLH
ncbi:MAG: hypothetical protein O3B95_08560 [Chloroflexi bacterium]|nr:hypothetical protein [Chloroflexota bacterium]